ncbi:MAG TPA: hypothetical protein VMY36_04795 [Patescibacteria group bacterium]|nr:hypothetical protein [Patescibacteria group bacterium]
MKPGLRKFFLTRLNKLSPLFEKFSGTSLFSLIFFLSLFLFIFSFNYTLPRDPDLGWHLRYGEEIIKSRTIPVNDFFSHSFYGQSITDTEWLTDVISFSLFSQWPFLRFALFFGFLTTFAFFIPAIFLPGSFFGKFSLITWALLGSMSVIEIGGRPQNISWVLFSLTVVILIKYSESKKFRYLYILPPIFLVWANVHPGFFLGLFLLVVFLCLELIFSLPRLAGMKKKILVFALILVFAFGFANIRPHAGQFEGLLPFELIKAFLLPVNIATQTSFKGEVRTSINEWLPPTFLDLSGVLFFLGIIFSIAIFIIKPISKKNVKYLVLLPIFIYFSTLSMRNKPFFFLIFIPAMIVVLKDYLRARKLKPFLPFLNFLAVVVMLVISIPKITANTRTILNAGSSVTSPSYCQLMNYPCKAIESIKKEKPFGKMFNGYNWGGFLIWELREYPVFIDGRVPEEPIFTEYQTVTDLKEGWEKVLEKYDISWILYHRNPLFEDFLKRDGKWREIYADEISVILVKK